MPKLTIRGKRFTGAYQPVAGTDQIISVHDTISATRAKGTFRAGTLCQGGGRFRAHLK